MILVWDSQSSVIESFATLIYIRQGLTSNLVEQQQPYPITNSHDRNDRDIKVKSINIIETNYLTKSTTLAPNYDLSPTRVCQVINLKYNVSNRTRLLINTIRYRYLLKEYRLQLWTDWSFIYYIMFINFLLNYVDDFLKNYVHVLQE